MNRSQGELEELGDKLRRTLSMARQNSGAQAGSEGRDDVNRGMSHITNQQ